MNLLKISLAAAAIAALVPAVSSASPEKSALDACARAFVSSLAAPGGAAPTYKVDYRGVQFVQSVADVYSRGYTFFLFAKSSKTGLPMAQASCAADYHGAVVALSPIPSDAARQILAARN
jgi:hypothetical protein